MCAHCNFPRAEIILKAIARALRIYDVNRESKWCGYFCMGVASYDAMMNVHPKYFTKYVIMIRDW